MDTVNGKTGTVNDKIEKFSGIGEKSVSAETQVETVIYERQNVERKGRNDDGKVGFSIRKVGFVGWRDGLDERKDAFYYKKVCFDGR